MTDDEFRLWADGNERLLIMFKAASPCRDCTPLWHADMVAGGMCDGTPGTGDAEPAKCGPKSKLHEHTYAELKAMRAQYPKFGAPADLRIELARARWRERDRDRRRVVA